MQIYKITPHKSDISLKAQGSNMKELFANSLEGMNRILNRHYEKELNGHTVMREIDITSFDEASLLDDFLSEVLSYIHQDQAIFYNVDHMEIKDGSLHAHLVGTKIHHMRKNIKGIAYHEADIRIGKDGLFETKIVFDI